MRTALYIIAILISLFLVGLGFMGLLGTAVSQKYEVDDQTVQIRIEQTVGMEQKLELEKLNRRINEINSDYIFFECLIGVGITSTFVLLITRKRILKK